MYTDFDSCWNIFMAKDRTYDGVFMVGVMSTKIYCRPSCTANPLRKNVRFFGDKDSARRAGLRPCKRCTPDDIPLDVMLCQKVCRYIESCADSPSLVQIATAVGYSQFHLQRTFRQVMGITPFAYAQAIRIMRLQHFLQESTTVQEAIFRAGYKSVSAFYHAHKGRNHRPTPDAHMTYGMCDYAGLKVIGVFSSRGIQFCGVYEDEITATAAARNMWPSLADVPQEEFSTLLAHYISLSSTPELPPQLDQDIRATTFQQQVWQAIRQIPFGQTAYYKQIAKTIGRPTATRAVANACAQNPLALITPCHRVLPSHSTPGGYRWGADVKARLISYESRERYNGEETSSR